MNRELGTFERALVIADQHAPFHIVSVLRLEGAPPPQILGQSLRVLQNRHPFLSMRLLKEKRKYYFEKLVEPGLPFHVLPRWNDTHWMQVAEVALGKRMDVSAGPLFRCTYLYDSTHQTAEIILVFCHSITDASSAARLMHELLTTCASILDEKTVTVSKLPLAPAAESRFPPGYRGLGLTLRSLRYALQQMADEISYRIRTRRKRIPPLHKRPTRGHILSMQLPEDLTDALSRRARQEKVTLNSALNAAMMIAVNRELYAGQHVPMRTFSFADLRPHVIPPLNDEHLACYISMLRYTVLVEGGVDFWELARQLHEKIYSSLKSGDKFIANAMTESLIRMITDLKSFRMSATALNYNGVIPVESSYGIMKVTGIHGFVSAYDLGPELAAQAQLFNDQLSWDFVYLDADMTRDEAIAITEEIRTILLHAVGR